MREAESGEPFHSSCSIAAAFAVHFHSDSLPQSHGKYHSNPTLPRPSNRKRRSVPMPSGTNAMQGSSRQAADGRTRRSLTALIRHRPRAPTVGCADVASPCKAHHTPDGSIRSLVKMGISTSTSTTKMGTSTSNSHIDCRYLLSRPLTSCSPPGSHPVRYCVVLSRLAFTHQAS